MISNVMKDLLVNGSAIRAMFEDGKIMAQKYGKENIFDFSLGNPSIVPPQSVKESLIDIIETEPEMALHGYMSNAGFDDVRESTANAINQKQGTSFTKDNIVMTVGAGGALNVVFKTILNPEDEVIIIAPFFAEYKNYINNFLAKTVVVSPNLENFGINYDELSQKITSKTKAVLINSPNNPSGKIYNEDEIRELARVLNQKQQELGTTIYLISDEPYREIAFDGREVPYLTKYYNNTFVGYSYSKSLSIPGERIGYIVISDTMDDFAEVAVAVSTANRVLGFVNAPSLLQKLAGRCVGQTADLSVYEENKNILYKALTEMGYECYEPEGTFYMFPKCPIADDKEFCAVAKEYKLLIVPGSGFGCPGYFRIAFCVEKSVVERSLAAFKQLIDRYKA